MLFVVFQMIVKYTYTLDICIIVCVLFVNVGDEENPRTQATGTSMLCMKVVFDMLSF